MKNKLRNIFKNIYKNLFVYVIGIILVPAMVVMISYNLTKVKEIEKFSLFFTTNKIENDILHEELSDLFKEYKLLQGYQYCSSIKEQGELNYKTDLTNYGISLSDFIFIPSSIATENFLAYNINAYKDYYESGISYGKDKKVTYAIKIYDKETKTGKLTNIVNYELEEDYYMCISKNSYHYNDYKNNDKSVILSFINWVLDHEN